MNMNTKRRGLRGVLFAGAVLVGFAGPAAAQPQGPPGRMERPQIERRIMELYRTGVARELGVDSTTRAALFDVVEQLQDERRALHMREVRLQRRLRGTGVYLSDEQSAEALEEFVAIKREEIRLLELENERLAEVLSPPQILRLYQLREEMGERIRRLRGGERGPRGAPSGQPLP